MKTKLIAAAVAASLITAAAAVAQTPPPGGPPAGPPGASEGRGPGGPGGWGPGRRMMRLSPEDRAAMIDARLAAFKAMLRLRTEQEQHWPALETALREAANQRFQRMTERFERRREMREGRGQQGARDPIQRMRAASDRMAEGAATLRKIADAAQPLYATLDEGQKRRADRMIMRGRGMMGGGMMMGGRGEWGGGRGEWGGGRGGWGGPGGWGDGPRRGGPGGPGEGGGRL